VFAELARVSPIHEGITYQGVADGGTRWPVRDGESVDVLHEDRFEHGERRAPFVPVAFDAAPGGNGLVLLTSRGIDEFVGETPADGDRTVQLHPADATSRALADGQSVIVAASGSDTQDAKPRTRADLSITSAVSEGTAFASPTVAERIAGAGRTTVEIFEAGHEDVGRDQ
jgi:predicted molibdopterin-dependent oxidoreductase YjgC